MPEDPNLSFKNDNKKMKIPFVANADFDSCQPDPESSYTTRYQKHQPSGFCIYVNCFDDSLGFKMGPYVYLKKNNDENISEKFVKILSDITKRIYKNCCKTYITFFV